MNRKHISSPWRLPGLFTVFLGLASLLQAERPPNVLLIVCDDLNDYIEPLDGHPQAKTPHIQRFAESGVSFTQAHCTIPICNPSRASFAFGFYPHTTQLFGFENWTENAVLKNSRSMMRHFSEHGYQTLGTGKIMHNRDEEEWDEFGHPSDYGPFGWLGGKDNLPHPDTPAPFRDDFGAIDGSFGPLRKLTADDKVADGRTWKWRTGSWKKRREFHYESETDRDHTGDELHAEWAVKRLRKLAADPDGKPFFMGVGLLRPHTPLIVPQTYFDRHPLDTLELPVIKPGDADDTFKHTVTSSEDDRSGDRGVKIHDSLVASYGNDRERALKHFVQAYLASVASVDDLVGQILDAVDTSPLKDNTIVVFTSDHGWGNGEKGYVYKNSLWQESTRVPLIIRAPGVAQAGTTSDEPVSLVDLYPSLLDLCGLPTDTSKNKQGKPLDGHSVRPLLADPEDGRWEGPGAALTALYKWADYYDPAKQSYSLRDRNWRYIRYENGREELYHCAEDPHEWTNLALDPAHAETLATYRAKLLARIPESKPEKEKTPAEWKAQYFRKHRDADTNGDGSLSWAELKAHKDAQNSGATPKADTPPGGTSAGEAQSERLQTSGTFTKGQENAILFTDAESGRSYFLIAPLHHRATPLLGKTVKLVARVKPAKSGKSQIMVHIVSIQE